MICSRKEPRREAREAEEADSEEVDPAEEEREEPPLLAMPVRKVKGGWRWGRHGKIYKTKAAAQRQARAAYAHGYRR
jgi:hypothetical protein